MISQVQSWQLEIKSREIGPLEMKYLDCCSKLYVFYIHRVVFSISINYLDIELTDDIE